MKLLTALTLAMVAIVPSVAHAGDVPMYFTPHERATPYALGFGPIDNRYPRPGFSAAGLNIPNGAGAPVPLDPFAIARPYAEGEAAVPLYFEDAKGRATHDAKGRAAWDGSHARMAW